MFAFKDLKLKQQILIGYVCPSLLTLAVAGIGMWSTDQLQQHNKASEIGWQLVQDTDRLDLAIAKFQRAARGYLLTPDPSYLQDYNENVKLYRELGNSLNQLMTRYSSPVQQERLQKLLQLGEELYQDNNQLITLVQAGKRAEAVRSFSHDQFRQLRQELTNLINTLNTEEERLQALRDAETQTAVQRAVTIAILGAILAVLSALLLGIAIANPISQTLNSIVNTVASSSTEIAAAVEQQERVVNHQASAVSQTTTTVDELGASSKATAVQAEANAVAAQQVLNLVDGGHSNSRSTFDPNSSLREKVEQIAQQILHLSHQVSQIDSIANLASSLANQTNMLALNAAVEAVRAGEHGKGFAVVASEIRKLADQSSKAAERINVLVSDIQTATNSTVMVTDEGTKAVERIVSAINEITVNNQQISLTARQQAIAIQQIVDAMNTLNSSAQETASGITQTKIGTQKLNEVALDLKALV